jgi:hypothetical protein
MISLKERVTAFWDDLSHSICAVYSDRFVTGDVELLKRLAPINPHLRLRNVEGFAQDLGIHP